LPEIHSDIESIGNDPALFEEKNFARRAQAIDDLEFKVLDRIEGLLQTPNPSESLLELKRRAEQVKLRLEKIDDNLFRRLREAIRGGECEGAAFREMIGKHVGIDAGISGKRERFDYDTLDTFFNGLLHFRDIPTETLPRESEMVFYQKTPARVILELAGLIHPTPEDVFYDLGSGLGQVQILIHLLSGVRSKGIEFEPAYCGYAKACAADLNLTGVEFIQADARTADYSDGTLFFLYTPFEGAMLQAVLERLRAESRKRRIRLFTYGPCTLDVSRQGWLSRLDRNGDDIHRLAAFRSENPLPPSPFPQKDPS
jgi:hypothetical protein